MDVDHFLTIQSPSKGFFKEKGSRFLSYAFPVTNENQIHAILEDLRKQYHDARHHCYAWKLGTGPSHFRSNDDGEPCNSAGKPILGQILSFQLTNVLVIVVRYFGGTLLGVGGLIQAYKAATMDALKNARIIQQFVMVGYKLTFRYEEMNRVMKVLKDLNPEQWDQRFELDCELKLKIKKTDEKLLLKAFKHGSSVKLETLPEIE